MTSYKIDFENLGEIRMGSPYNLANVLLTGEFVPDLPKSIFQDKGVVSTDGNTCYLVEWDLSNDNGGPGYRVWKISAADKQVTKSHRFEGCCAEIKLVGDSIVTTSWIWDSRKGQEERTNYQVNF